MATDPFGNDEHNPFAEVDDYNPFAGRSPTVQPRVVVNETPQPSGSSQPRYGATTAEVDSDSDDAAAPSYFDMQEENPYSFTNEKPVNTQSTSRGVVTVSTESAKRGDELSVWEIAYYQQFFNVESEEVGWRCLRSMWPFKVDFINFVSINPDFYGPFWICTTLIFMMAACSNFSTYLWDPVNWKYDFLKLTVGTGIIYGYAFAVPFLFWLYFKWADIEISLIELLCIYGYSFFIYIPVAIVCIAPFNPVQWAAHGVGCLISTSFLIVNMWHPLRGKLAHAIPLVLIMAALHIGIGLTFMLYFFQFRTTPAPMPTPAPVPQPHPAPQPQPGWM